jgi:hypothetical protein
MAKGKKTTKSSKASSAKPSTRKTGFSKQTTMEKSLNLQKQAGKDQYNTMDLDDTGEDTPNKTATAHGDLVDTDDDEEEITKIGTSGDQTTTAKLTTSASTNLNGKRTTITNVPGSILRQAIRAKHSGNIRINPYTPVRETLYEAATQERSEPVKDCDTKWRSRFTVKLSIPESTNALETFSTTLQELFKELESNCDNKEKLFILPWWDKDIDKVDSIDNASDIPLAHSKLSKFIPKFYPGKGNAQVCYFNLYLGHDRQLEEMQADAKYWLMSGAHGMYFESLQCESSELIGWLLWSLKSMDVTALAEDILQMTGIQVGLRWMAIDTGAKGKVEMKDKIFALHLEVRKRDKRNARKAFLALYGKTNSDAAELPLYLRLRFITPRREATSGATITKLKRFRERQKNFLTKICTSSLNTIVHLDWRKDLTKQTLRELMMELKSTVYENTPVFFSVDLDWNKTNHIVSYLPVMKEEAVHTLHTLIPQLRHVLADQEATTTFVPLTIDELHSFFTDEAVEDTEEMYFDKELGRIVDPLTDANLEIIDNENLLGNDEEALGATPAIERPELRALQTGTFPGNCDDSISTLGHSLATGMLSPEQNAKARAARRASRSSASVTSNSTGVSVEDFTNLKRDVGSMASTVERLACLMEKFASDDPTKSTTRISFDPSADKMATGEGSL